MEPPFGFHQKDIIMALHVDLSKLVFPTIDEKEWNELLKTMSLNDAAKHVQSKKVGCE